jgi:hypothetical protein
MRDDLLTTPSRRNMLSSRHPHVNQHGMLCTVLIVLTQKEMT